MIGQFMYMAQNPKGPEIMLLEVWRLSVKIAGDIAFIGDDWMSLAFEGEMLADEVNHPENPYFKLTIG